MPQNAPHVIHISADFPDSIEPFKTPVIKTLVHMTQGDFDHEVLSLNRVTPRVLPFVTRLMRGFGRPQAAISFEPFEQGTAISFVAPPKGLFHATMLHQLADALSDRIARQGRQPTLLIGHKLTIEGVVARRIAKRLNVPYAVSIQGDTDTKILRVRPDLAAEFRKVFQEAAVVFPFSPWSLRKVEAKLGQRGGPVIMLPCPTDIDAPVAPVPGGNGFVSCFHLKNHKRKNLAGMVDAMRILNADQAGARLSIIGGGSDRDVNDSRAAIGKVAGIELAGPMNRDQLRERFGTATAFVMPSHRESFGLVFIEALFCGLPIIYPADQAVDGYFDGAPFAIRVDARNPAAIAAAMRKVMTDESAIKRALAQWQNSADARRFMRPAIAANFALGMNSAIAAAEPR